MVGQRNITVFTITKSQLYHYTVSRVLLSIDRQGMVEMRALRSALGIIYLFCELCVCVCDRKDTSQLPSTSWSHVEVVHYTMLFLVSLAHSYADVVQPVLCNCHNLSHWLKRLTLESPEVCFSLAVCSYISYVGWQAGVLNRAQILGADMC